MTDARAIYLRAMQGCQTEQNPRPRHHDPHQFSETFNTPQPQPRPRQHDDRQFSQSEPKLPNPRHHDARQFSETSQQAPPPRHYDTRMHMHTPLGTLNHEAPTKNPQKIGVIPFLFGSRRGRVLPEAPTPKEAVQKTLKTDKADYGLADAPPSAKLKTTPGEIPTDPDSLFIGTLRGESSLSRRRSNSMSALNISTEPSVFDRLADPKSATGIHRSRFNEAGSGRGLLGSRDDTTAAVLNAGKGIITRDSDLVVPAAFITPEQRQVLDQKHAEAARRAKFSSKDAYTDQVMKSGVFARLTTPRKPRPESDYEKAQKIHRKFGSMSQLVF